MATQATKQDILSAAMYASAEIVFNRSRYLRPVLKTKMEVSRGGRINWSRESNLRDSTLEVLSWACDKLRLAKAGRLSKEEEEQVYRLWRVRKAGRTA